MIDIATNRADRKETFYRVFNSRSPFDPAGREKFPVRAILYPTDMYHLNAEQFHALMGAIHDCGEREFLISLVEAEPEERNWGGEASAHWSCREPTFEEYTRLDLPTENAVYSPRGSWGILLSHEMHGLLVCGSDFWCSFIKEHPKWREGYDGFVKLWKGYEDDGASIDWLEPLLAHITRRPENKEGIWLPQKRS